MPILSPIVMGEFMRKPVDVSRAHAQHDLAQRSIDTDRQGLGMPRAYAMRLASPGATASR